MANANTNLVQVNLNPTAPKVGSATRISRNAQFVSNHAGKNNFSTALDKATAQINQQAPQETSAEIQPVETQAPVAPPSLEESAAQNLPQGRNELAQDAPIIQTLTPEIISQPAVENLTPQEISTSVIENLTPQEISQPVIENLTPQEISQPVIENLTPQEISQPVTENLTPQEISQPVTENLTPQEISQPVTENLTPQEISQPVAENLTPQEISTPVIENLTPQEISTPAIENLTPQEISQPVTENLTPQEISTPVIENLTPQEISTPVTQTSTPVKSEESPEIVEAPPIQPIFSGAAYLFSSSPETLLATKTSESPQPVNLMAVMPQAPDNKSQSMLNLLSGKTWQASDVQSSVVQQNQQALQAQIPTPTLSQPVAQIQSAPAEIPTQIPAQPATPTTPQPQFQAQSLSFNSEAPFQPQISAQPTQIISAQPQVQISAQSAEIIANQPQIQIQPQVQTLTQPTQIISPQVQAQTPAQPQILAQSSEIISPQPQIQTPPAQISEQPQIQIQPQVQTLTQAPQVQSQAATQPQNAQQFSATIQPVVNSVAPPVDSQPQIPQQQISELVGVQVETQTTPAAPVQAPPQFQQQFSQQQQPDAQTFQQNLAQVSPENLQTLTQDSSADEFSPAQNLTPPISNNTAPLQQPAATQVQTPETLAQTPRDEFNVAAQIVQQARLIRTAENTEMVINLKPEHLGQLTLRISVSQNGAVNASFFSDNAQVRTVIENSLVQLRQELNDQGLKVENVQVYSGLSDGGLTNGQGQQAWQQNQQQPSARRFNAGSFEEEVDSIAPTNENSSTDGVDYKI